MFWQRIKWWFEEHPYFTVFLVFVVAIILWWTHGISSIIPPQENGFQVCEPAWNIGDVRYRCQWKEVP